jgi:hypothetical protein
MNHCLLTLLFLSPNSSSTPRFSLYLKANSSFGNMGKVDIALFPQIRHLLLGILDLSK